MKGKVGTADTIAEVGKIARVFSEEMTAALKAGREDDYHRLLADLNEQMAVLVKPHKIQTGVNPFAQATDESRFYGSVVCVHHPYGEFITFVHRVHNGGTLLEVKNPYVPDLLAGSRFRTEMVSTLLLIDWEVE